MKKARTDIYAEVTQRIITALEKSDGKVVLPWHRSGNASYRPQNILTNRPYTGINTLLLWLDAEERGFSNGLWGTYLQWQQKGAQVQKGAKSSVVIVYREYEKVATDNDGKPVFNPLTGEPLKEPTFYAKAARVFNVEQVEGFSEELPEQLEPVANLDTIDEFVRNTEADIRHGGPIAAYNPGADYIKMPHKEAFFPTEERSATEGYYSVLLHELTHWTGHKTRCNRDFKEKFGHHAYAIEELVAEIGSAYLSATLGLAPEFRQDHADYIKNWLEALKEHKTTIFTAASQAQQAVDYLKGLQPPWVA